MENQDPNDMKILAIDSKYRKILIAAKRSKQIQRGARPRINLSGSKPTRIALEEVERGLINFEVTQGVEK
ncbi:MAG: DNA-directed RNA polymerase subunit omega [Acidobacteria bacterium]|nr:DNA-directed RNA polymerase subunit omega [Acidobacteriota bacterium]